MNIVDDAGATEPHPRETGKAYWLPASPPGTQHADVNPSPNPIEVMIVELKKTNRLRLLPPAPSS
jgi:beta-alanine degradation protein BauB